MRGRWRPTAIRRRPALLLLLSSCLYFVLRYTLGAKPKRLRSSAANLDAWRAYAASRLCSTADDSYRQVFSDLSRFRNARITQQDVLDAFRKSPHPKLTSLIHVHNGSVHVEGSNEEEAKVAYITSTIQKFAHELPNLSFVFYAGDIPLSWIAPLPADVEHEIQTGIVTAQEAWRRYGCEGVEHLRGINTSLHGVFQQLAGFRGLAPVFGAYHIEDCFADILVPVPRHIPVDVKQAVELSGCPIHGAWHSKKEIAYWRGASTGAPSLAYEDNVSRDMWHLLHRQRLVELARLEPSHVDAAFTAFVQCKEEHCAEMNATYGLAPAVAFKDMADHKYLIAVDGNGAPDSMEPLLCSGSLVLDASLLKHWYSSMLIPYGHFIPVRLDYSDLKATVDWARQHDSQARRIAEAASTFVNTQLRSANKECYIYRLLLEYAALYQP